MTTKPEVLTAKILFRDYWGPISILFAVFGFFWLSLSWIGYEIVEVIQTQHSQQEEINQQATQMPLVLYQLSDLTKSMDAVKKNLGIL